jgi:hypothetical protein
MRKVAPIPSLATIALVGLALLPGCGGGDDPTLLGSYLNELEFDEPLESATTIELGKFDVPVAAVIKIAGESSRTVWIRIKFELYAETLPADESELTQALEHHRGALNDAVLSIIRTSSVDELTDPRASAVRMRITEAVRPLLGDAEVQQLVLDQYNADRI